MREKDKFILVFFVYAKVMIDISVELNYLIKHGYEPSCALRFIMEGNNKDDLDLIILKEKDADNDEE